MADGTGIEWCDATWNIVTGCSVVSPGCTNCYAMRLAGTRLRNEPSRRGLTAPSAAGPVWTGEARFNKQWLDQPLRWRRPRRIFVCAHGDLFHEAVHDDWIDLVFAVMALAPQHTFIVLTKRAQRMRDYLTDADMRMRIWEAGEVLAVAEVFDPDKRDLRNLQFGEGIWPLPNVWLGVSVEDQARADRRIPHLLATPAARRFLSAEPLLGPIDLLRVGYRLDWVIVGGESRRQARPMHPDWARALRDQCGAAGVAFFMKQMDKREPIPADLFIREFPDAHA